MFRAVLKLIAPAIAIGGLALSLGVAHAAPVLAPLALKNASAPAVEDVRWRGGWHGHGGRGWGWGGFAAGAIIGGALASRYYAPYGPYYAPYPYYPPYGVYAPPPPPGYYGYGYGGGVGYCMRRFRSYDPMSRTYLGYDGFRHPCP